MLAIGASAVSHKIADGAAAAAQWKVVDADDLLYFPTIYSVGLGLYVMVGHDASPGWTGHTGENPVVG